MNAHSNSKQSINKSLPAAAHRRQMLWQVWVPLGISIFIMLGLGVLAIIGAFQQSPQVARWGNLSAVWIIIPVLFSILLLLAVVGACIYGMSKLLHKVPDWMLRLQLLFIQVQLLIRRVADTSTKPVMGVHGFGARVTSLQHQLFGKK